MQWPVPFGSRASTGAKVPAVSSASAIAHQCNCQRREKGTLRLSIIVSTPKRHWVLLPGSVDCILRIAILEE